MTKRNTVLLLLLIVFIYVFYLSTKKFYENIVRV
jgi:hypothetical protein